MSAITAELAVYNTIHRHPLNRLIHAVGIPVIMFAVAGFAGLIGVGDGISTGYGSNSDTVLALTIGAVDRTWIGHVLNGGTLLALTSGWIIGRYSVRSGVALALFSLGMSFAANAIAIRIGTASALFLFAGCFVGGWAVQFLGHAIERAGPAFGSRPLNLLLGPVAVLNEILPLDPAPKNSGTSA